MARTTKLELEQLLAQRNAELQAARERISILEGELALRPRAAKPNSEVAPRQVRIGGVLCNVINERHGQATRKRYVPVVPAEDSYDPHDEGYVEFPHGEFPPFA